MINLYKLMAMCTLSLLVAGAPRADIPEDIDKFVRIGLGYRLSEGTTVLGERLPLSDPNFQHAKELPEFPDSCFREPGVTSISGIEVSKPKDIIVATYVGGLAGVDLKVHCGERSTGALAVLEIPIDGKWHRLVNPQDHVVNAYLEEAAFRILEQDQESHNITASRNDKGGIDLAQPEREMISIGIRSLNGIPRISYFMRYQNESMRDSIYDVLTNAAGCDAHKSVDKISGVPAIIILGETVDPSTVLEDIRRFISTAISYDIVELNVRTQLGDYLLSAIEGTSGAKLSAEEAIENVKEEICQY